MKGLFGDLFDLNGDGEMSATESALEFALFSEMMDEDDEDSDTEDNSSEWEA